ncbi:MAG: metal-dependent hydrolase [Acidobacteria bacterium]|nr:metal-dependent hydrolase [Acidobacteriota bacterium]
MENITHSLFGLALYRSGFERYVPNSMMLWIIGANLPDIDIIAQLFGKTAYLDHHRGFTHSVLGIIILSLVLSTFYFFFLQRRYSRNKLKAPPEKNGKSSPPIWLRLFLASLLAVGTHPLLDALNNYGIRPFQPLNQNWFYGDLVFIVDPWIWLILGGTIFLSSNRSKNLASFWVVVTIIAWQVMFFSGRVANLALAIWSTGILLITTLRLKLKETILINRFSFVRGSLILLCFYLAGLFYFQGQALDKTGKYLEKEISDPIRKFSVSPTAANPFGWEYLAESQNYFYYGKLNLINGNFSSPKKIFIDRNNPVLEQALKTKEGLAMKNFSRYLIAELEPTTNGTNVTLCDGRYVRDFRGSHPEFACIKVLVSK